jgi:ligand-binding sensor protein
MENPEFVDKLPEKVRINLPGLENITGFDRLQKILEEFAKLGNISINAVGRKGENVTKRYGLNVFCAKMMSSPEFGTICKNAHKTASEEAALIKDRFNYICPFGLLEVAVPVFSFEDCYGAIICGQAKCNNTPLGFIDMSAKKNILFSEKMQYDGIYKSLFDSIPVVEYSSFDIIISTIIETANFFAENFKENRTQSHRFITPGEILVPSQIRTEKYFVNLFFLLNTVNTISNLAVLHGADKINNLAILTARFIKNAINNVNREFCSLEEEKAGILRYLNIQKTRFEELLNFTINLPLDLKDFLVPADAILPFIEKIFAAGQSAGTVKFYIGVFIRKAGESIIFEITDNLSVTLSSHSGFLKSPYKNDSEIQIIENRILNSTERLFNLFGNGANVTYSIRDAGGNTCLIRFPAILPETEI